MKTSIKNAASNVVTTMKDASANNSTSNAANDVKSEKALERAIKALNAANEGKTLSTVGAKGRKWNEAYLQSFVPNADLNDERVSKKARTLARVRFNSFAAPFKDIEGATLSAAQRSELKALIFNECTKAFDVVKSESDLSLLKDSYRGSNDKFASVMFTMLDKVC